MTKHHRSFSSLPNAVGTAVIALSLSAQAATTLFTSDFDGNTGATVLPGNTDNLSGSASLGVTWTTDASVTAISSLTAISTGDSGTLGGFVQLQGGSATYANVNNVYLSRNHNLDSDRSTSKRGFSLTFTITNSWDLDTLTVLSGHSNNTGNQDQAFSSDLFFSLSGGTLGAPVTASSNEDYGVAPAYHTISFSLLGTTLGAGTYTLDVYQSNMPGGGAYAIYDGITLSANVDSDFDGLDDGWEYANFGNLLQDGFGDVLLDNDGSNNEEEETRGTDPNDPDSDHDGFHDGAETLSGYFTSYDYGNNTGDTGTDPLDPDTDEDELPDGVESNTGTFLSVTNTGTDPNYYDSDFDSLEDGWEVAYNLDPTLATTPNGTYDDPDVDNLDNLTEQTEGTDPRNADTDEDGVDDDVELLTNLTDPLNPDTDGDGLTEGEEMTEGTDPLNPDTDGDTYTDGAEVAAGSDPLLNTSVPGYAVLSSGFDTNTGAVVLVGNTDNTSGSTTLGVTWVKQASVTTVSDLTAISTGDSGTLGGFAQLQNGTAAYANANNAYLSRNHNLDSDRSTSRRGFSMSFTINAPVSLGALTVHSGHTTNTGEQDQSYASDLVFSLSGGTLTAPVAGTVREDYALAPAYHAVVFDLRGLTLGVGTYTLEVYQSNMTDGGAYAMFNGVSIDDPTVWPAPIEITRAGFNGAAFEMEVSGLDTNRNYLLLRSEDLLDDFPTQIGSPVTPTLTTGTFTDPSPSGTHGFYRIQEAP